GRGGSRRVVAPDRAFLRAPRPEALARAPRGIPARNGLCARLHGRALLLGRSPRVDLRGVRLLRRGGGRAEARRRPPWVARSSCSFRSGRSATSPSPAPGLRRG